MRYFTPDILNIKFLNPISLQTIKSNPLYNDVSAQFNRISDYKKELLTCDINDIYEIFASDAE